MMGRIATHTGQEITWDQVMQSEFQFVKDIDHLTFDTPAPIHEGPDGIYPAPAAGHHAGVLRLLRSRAELRSGVLDHCCAVLRWMPAKTGGSAAMSANSFCRWHLPIVLILMPPQRTAADDAELNRAIEQHRMGTLTVQAQPGATVRVEQLRHEFWFGAALSSGPFSPGANAEQTAKYKQIFLENFNAAVTENALKWHSMETQAGHRRLQHRGRDPEVDRRERDPPARTQHLLGHREFVQDWQKQLNDDQLREVVKNERSTWARAIAGGLPSTI